MGKKDESKKKPYEITTSSFREGLFLTGAGYGGFTLDFADIPQFIADVRAALITAQTQAEDAAKMAREAYLATECK